MRIQVAGVSYRENAKPLASILSKMHVTLCDLFVVVSVAGDINSKRFPIPVPSNNMHPTPFRMKIPVDSMVNLADGILLAQNKDKADGDPKSWQILRNSL